MVIWVLLAFWMAVLAVIVGAVWFYRNYPERQAMIARAERQHRALMEGDDLIGNYGDYPPAAIEDHA